VKGRKGISKKVRFEVFKRDSFRCVYCGSAASEVFLVVDHVEPVAKGGPNDIMNLVSSCESCNAGKGDRILSDASVIAKRRKQSEMLAERREQALAVLEWQRGLAGIREEIARKTLAPLMQGTGWELSESGLRKVMVLIKEVGVEHVVEAASSSTEFLVRDESGNVSQESWEKAYGEVFRRARWFDSCAKEPNLRDAAKLRAGLRYRFPGRGNPADWSRRLSGLLAALNAGISVEKLRGMLSECRSPWQVDDVLAEIRKES